MALLGRCNMAHAIIFDRSGNAVEVSNVLRNSPALVMRGTFGHAELLDPPLFESAKRQVVAEGTQFDREPVDAIELTTRHATRSAGLSPAEMLRRVRELTPQCPVIV